jgi:glycerol-3-phosphate acyltransferase PlsY
MPDPLGDFSYTWPFYAAAVIGYLIGSIPFGMVLTRFAGAGDIRRIGSGSIGATNVLRTGRKGLAAATLLLDAGKGALAALLGLRYGPDIAWLASAGVVIGHCFPVWLWFRGGKGVATALGVMLALMPPVGALACVTWLVVAGASRYSSVASLVAMAASPVYAWALADPQRTELAVVLAVVVALRHHGNIRRLIKREESRIQLRKS